MTNLSGRFSPPTFKPPDSFTISAHASASFWKALASPASPPLSARVPPTTNGLPLGAAAGLAAGTDGAAPPDEGEAAGDGDTAGDTAGWAGLVGASVGLAGGGVGAQAASRTTPATRYVTSTADR